MGQGIRIFGDDKARTNKGGSWTSSSNTSFAQFAFDGEKWSKWYSSGEDTNGDQVHVERDFGQSTTVEAFFAWGTNISDLIFQYWDDDGSAWVDVDSDNATLLSKVETETGFFLTSAGEFFLTSDEERLIVDNGGEYYYCAILNGTVDTTKIRVIGEDTGPADEEKEIKMFMTFENIGQFEYRPELLIGFDPSQSVKRLEGAKHFIFEQGESVFGSLNFVNHSNQNDIDLYNSIVTLKQPFFVWKCGGDEDQFTYLHEGHRFEDIYKVSMLGKRQPVLKNNRYNLALNVSVPLIEVQ